MHTCFDLLCILSYKYQVNLEEARTYEILSLGSPVLKDPVLDGSNDFLHVLTKKKVTTILFKNLRFVKYSSTEE